MTLVDAVHACFAALPAAPDRFLEARSLAFGAQVIARARRDGRLDVDVDAAFDAYRMAPLSPALREVARGAVDAMRPDPVGSTDVVAAYERVLAVSPDADVDGRSATGAFFTPPGIVDCLLRDGLDPALVDGDPGAVRICDPSCGAGAFLVAAHRRLADALARAGVPEAAERAAHAVHGVDVDRAAVELCRALVWEQTRLPLSALPALTGFRVGDGLLGATPVHPGEASSVSWHAAFPGVFAPDRGPVHPRTGAPGGFDVVIGNPPYLGQLKAGSARSASARARLRARFGDALGAYADTAVAFQLLALDLLRPGGRSTLVLPASVLASRDAAAVRAHLARDAALEAVWLATDPAFPGVSVFPFAPTLRRGGHRRTRLARRRDVAFVEASARDVDMDRLAEAGTWAPLVADLLGIPAVDVRGEGRVGDAARVTADFRDQYYGLRGFVVESGRLAPDADLAAFPPLVTTGLVDPATCHWGRRATRFDKTRWEAPRVDLARLEREGTQGPWARGRLVGKVLLATQTKVLEPVVDADGAWIPCTPLISVVPDAPGRLWHLAAALASPVLTALAAATTLGTALSVGAIKVSASQVRDLPLPADGPDWDAAADAFRAAQCDPERRDEHLRACAERMCAAYGVGADEVERLVAWWEARGARRGR